MTAIDPLDRLFVPHEASIIEIAEFLLNYCRIDLPNNKVRFDSGQWILIESKVLLYLMCLRVMNYKNQRKTISAAPSEIAECIGAIPGSVRPKIRELFAAKLITREENKEDGRKSSYSIPMGNLNEAMKYIREATRLANLPRKDESK